MFGCMRRLIVLTLAAMLLSAQSAASYVLHCLGRSPPFMMVIEDDTARFDYLGDGCST
jgi:hypothetical protein